MKSKKKFTYLIILLAFTLFTTSCGKTVDPKNGSKVAVSVKGGKITATEYYKEIKKNNISRLVDMIDHKILDKKYPTNDDETKEVESQIKQLKNNYGSNEETFKNVLEQYFGVDSEEELEEMLRLEYKRNKAVEDYVEDNLKDDEIQKYYDEKIIGEIKASHILISVDAKEDATEEEKEKAEKKAKKEAEKIIKKLEKGEDFAELAKKYSKDTATAANGGDLGYFDGDDMIEEFTEAAKKLKKNEYTKEPIKTKYGYHIILKTDQKSKPKLKKVKSDIKEKLREQKLEEDKGLHYQTLMDIRKKNKITWKDDELKKEYNELMEKLIEEATKDTTN